jgi:hypothetical protein
MARLLIGTSSPGDACWDKDVQTHCLLSEPRRLREGSQPSNPANQVSWRIGKDLEGARSLGAVKHDIRLFHLEERQNVSIFSAE